MAIIWAGLEDGVVVDGYFKWDGGSFGVELDGLVFLVVGGRSWDKSILTREEVTVGSSMIWLKFSVSCQNFVVKKGNGRRVDEPDPLVKPVLNGLAVVSKRAGVLPPGIRASN